MTFYWLNLEVILNVKIEYKNMSINLSICNKKPGKLSWHIGYQYFGDLDYDTIGKILGDYSDFVSLEEAIARIERFEEFTGEKAQARIPNWKISLQTGQSDFVELYVGKCQISIFGEDLEADKNDINISQYNFKRYFMDYLGLQIDYSGSAHPLFFMKALDKAPMKYFGTAEGKISQKTDEQGNPIGAKFYEFGIDEDYISRMNLRLESLCQEAIQSESNICWA